MQLMWYMFIFLENISLSVGYRFDHSDEGIHPTHFLFLAFALTLTRDRLCELLNLAFFVQILRLIV